MQIKINILIQLSMHSVHQHFLPIFQNMWGYLFPLRIFSIILILVYLLPWESEITILQ